MMQLANPLWLWGLLGLLVPLAIHLLSRKEGKVIKVGSLRHLSDATTRQFKSLKLNEILLLALRSLLITLVVALLGGAMVKSTNKLPKWVLLERGVETSKEVGRMLDSLISDGYEVRYLEKGFPVPDDTLLSTATLDYWYLAEELGEIDLKDAVIFSKAKLSGFNGQRASKPVNASWFDVPVDKNESPSVYISEGDSAWQVESSSNESFVEYSVSKVIANGQTALAKGVEEIKIVYDDKHVYDQQILGAALSVVNSLPGMALEIVSEKVDAYTSGTATVVFWLADGETPQMDGKLVSIDEKESEDFLVRTGLKQWTFNDRLNKKTVLEHHLVMKVAALLQTELPSQAQHDHRVMPESWRWSKIESGDANGQLATLGFVSIHEWLLALLVITLITERLVAGRRGQ